MPHTPIHRRLLTLATALGVVALLAVGQADANPDPVGYATSSAGGQDGLYRLDVQTGAGTLVAATGLSPTTVLALAPDSTLYGVNRANDNLYTINPTTAAPTLIGPLGVSASGGQLTATGDGSLWFVRGSPSNLYQVNPSTGQATLVGSIGQGTVTGIAGTCSGHLFGIGPGAANLLLINPATGAGTVVGPTGLASDASLSLALDEGEHLWGVLFVSAMFDDVYRVNKVHGTATFVADTNPANNYQSLALPHTCQHGP